eukprot:6749787-Heterocapsa_arctica.AAC.1
MPEPGRSQRGGIALVAVRRHGARCRAEAAAAAAAGLRDVQAVLEHHIAALLYIYICITPEP